MTDQCGEHRLDITLAPELERFVNEQVKAGAYPSASAMVSDALTLLKVGDPDLIPTAELRRLIAEGQAQADRGQLIDGDAAFAERRIRFSE